MQLSSLSLARGVLPPLGPYGRGSPGGLLLANSASGFALAALSGHALVRWPASLSNQFSGDWNNKMHYDSPSSKLVRDDTGQYVAGTTLRCDHDADGVALGLRHEPSRTNVLLYSQDFSNAAWSKSDTTVTANATAAPDGTTTADLLTEGTAGTASVFQTGTMASANQAVAGSVFLKPSTNTTWIAVALRDQSDTTGVGVYVNLLTGAIGTIVTHGSATNVHAEVEKAKNGFWRVMVGATFQSGVSNARLYTRSASADNSVTRVNNAAYFAWQAQAELGENATSPIPTTSGAVNRAVDNIYLLTSEIPYSATKGTLYARFAMYRIGSGIQYAVALNDNTTNERISIRKNSASSNLAAVVIDGGSSVASPSSAGLLANAEIKAAASWKQDDIAFIVTGGTVQPDTSATLPTCDRLHIGSREGGTESLTGWIKEIVYVPEDESDAAITARVAATPLGQGTAAGDLLGDSEPLGVAIDLIADQLLIRQHIGSKNQGLNGGSILYNSPSAKNIVNGWGELESGTTLRCDHDPATLDTSLTAITDTSNGQKTMTMVGSVDFREGTLWVTATAYAVGQKVKYDTHTYRCKAAHTSGSTTEPGIGAGWATNWEIVDGYRIRLTDASNKARFMLARVVSFNTSTKVATINVYAQSGSFACSSWKVIVALGVLIEGAFTNVLKRSQDFSHSDWGKVDATITADATMSPDGTVNADLVTEGTAGTAAVAQTGTATTASAAVCGSIFVKPSANITWLRVILGDSTAATGVSTWVNLSTGALGTVSVLGSATSTGAQVVAAGNGFWKIELWATFQSGVSNVILNIRSAAADNSNTRVNNAAYYLWQADAGLGARPSSPVVTTSAAVIRAADDIQLLTARFPFDATKGTLYHRARPGQMAAGITYVATELYQTTGSEIALYHTTAKFFLARVGGVTQASLQGGAPASSIPYGACGSWKDNDFAASFDGDTILTDTSGTLPAPTTLALGSLGGLNSHLNGHLRRVAYWARDFSDAENVVKAAA